MKTAFKYTIGTLLTCAFFFEMEPTTTLKGEIGPSEAMARVGRPATPGSVAGVARRTTRRAIRRGAYYASLPKGCVKTTAYGYSVWKCGGAYYQASGSGYVVVYF